MCSTDSIGIADDSVTRKEKESCRLLCLECPPLDAEIDVVVNSIAHGLLIERVGPPPRAISREFGTICVMRKTVTCSRLGLTCASRIGDGTGMMTRAFTCTASVSRDIRVAGPCVGSQPLDPQDRLGGQKNT